MDLRGMWAQVAAEAMSVAVQILPPGPENADLRFDSCQFGSRKVRDDSIAHSDKNFGHVFSRKRRVARAGVPAFALDDKKLRVVLAAFITSCFSTSLIPRAVKWAESATAAELNELAALKLRRNLLGSGAGRVEIQHLARAVEHCGGRLEYLARIAFLTWRCGWDSVDVAQETRASPQAVRMNLFKMTLVARRLGFETYQPQKSFVPRPQKAVIVEPDPVRAAELVARARERMQQAVEILERQREFLHLSYYERHERGVCVNNCGRLARSGRVTCEECGHRDALRKRRERREVVAQFERYTGEDGIACCAKAKIS